MSRNPGTWEEQLCSRALIDLGRKFERRMAFFEEGSKILHAIHHGAFFCYVQRVMMAVSLGGDNNFESGPLNFSAP